MNYPSDIPYWLALAAKSALPIPKLEAIFNNHHSLEPLWTENVDFLRCEDFNDSEIRKILEYRLSVKINYYQTLTKTLESKEIKIIRYVDNDYPSILKDFGNYHIKPPLAFLLKGSVDALDEGVAIVGTRECSFHGHMMARRIARTIAKAGYIIYSGLARGVDTEAHCGALEASYGRTVAILPWLSEQDFYPEENINLAADITKKGAILSEYYEPPRVHPSLNARAAFVIRNRITSGLARCIILVESGATGGTYRQASIAKDQGRKMFAVKPKSDNKRAMEGFKQFIEMGATPIESAKPVLEFLSLNSGVKIKRIDSFSNPF